MGYSRISSFGFGYCDLLVLERRSEFDPSSSFIYNYNTTAIKFRPSSISVKCKKLERTTISMFFIIFNDIDKIIDFIIIICVKIYKNAHIINLWLYCIQVSNLIQISLSLFIHLFVCLCKWKNSINRQNDTNATYLVYIIILYYDFVFCIFDINFAYINININIVGTYFKNKCNWCTIDIYHNC